MTQSFAHMDGVSRPAANPALSRPLSWEGANFRVILGSGPCQQRKKRRCSSFRRAGSVMAPVGETSGRSSGVRRRGETVEGFTGRIVAGLLLGYLAFLVFAIVSLVALGLWIGRRTRAARITFAAGLLSATALLAVAALTFLGGEALEQPFSATVVLSVLALLVA